MRSPRSSVILTLLCSLLLFFSCSLSPSVPAQAKDRGETLSGNIHGLRPSFSVSDRAQAELSASYLKPGAIARTSTIFWEVYWSPNPKAGDFRGINAIIDIMAAHKLRPLFLLQPSPYPSSPWYAGQTWTDWWCPPRSSFESIFNCTAQLVDHIENQCKEKGLSPMYQLLNEPAGRLTNPFLAAKPGGSNRTEFGEWHPDLHELAFGIVQVLKGRGVDRDRIVAPAISCVGEGSKREATEWLSSVPPPQFNWSAECGYRAFHVRLSAGWATNPATRLSEVTRGFTWCAEYLAFCDKARPPGSSPQKVLITELYVTPGDCGLEIGDDLDPYRTIALKLCRDKGWTPIVWGLLPGETDGPGNKWLTYGGWGDYNLRH